MNDTTPGAPTPSGRFLLRIDPELHATLREAARRTGLSLNDLCARRLATPTSDGGGPGGAIVTRAAATFGDALLGVVVFGSWARGEAGTTSDVDVLIVVDGEIAVTRDLYRSWDREPVTWASRSVDVHFARAPAPDARVSGMWFDVAMDGVVLYDRDLGLSRLLVELRSRVASGRIVRRHVHGQSYWVEAA